MDRKLYIVMSVLLLVGVSVAALVCLPGRDKRSMVSERMDPEYYREDENGNVVSSESEDTSDNGSLYGNVTPPEPQGEQQIDENWSDGVTDQDLQIGTQ